MDRCRFVFCAIGIPDYRHSIRREGKPALLPEFLHPADAAHFSAVLWLADPLLGHSSPAVARPRRPAVDAERWGLVLDLPLQRQDRHGRLAAVRRNRSLLVPCRRRAVLFAMAPARARFQATPVTDALRDLP